MNFKYYFTQKHFRNRISHIKQKKGAVILIGGGDGNYDDAYKTACTILHHIKVTEIYPFVGSFNTNELPVIKDAESMKSIAYIANFSTN